MYDACKDLYPVSQILGHKSIETTRVYAEMSERRKADVMAAMEKMRKRERDEAE